MKTEIKTEVKSEPISPMKTELFPVDSPHHDLMKTSPVKCQPSDSDDDVPLVGIFLSDCIIGL